MFRTNDVRAWVSWEDGERILFNEGVPVELVVRAAGQSAVYLSAWFDPVSGEALELGAPLLLACGHGEFPLFLRHNGPVELAFLSPGGQGGSFCSQVKGHTVQEVQSSDPFTVVKPRLVISEEMRAMQLMLRQHKSDMERRFTELRIMPEQERDHAPVFAEPGEDSLGGGEVVAGDKADADSTPGGEAVDRPVDRG